MKNHKQFRLTACFRFAYAHSNAFGISQTRKALEPVVQEIPLKPFEKAGDERTLARWVHSIKKDYARIMAKWGEIDNLKGNYRQPIIAVEEAGCACNPREVMKPKT